MKIYFCVPTLPKPRALETRKFFSVIYCVCYVFWCTSEAYKVQNIVYNYVANQYGHVSYNPDVQEFYKNFSPVQCSAGNSRGNVEVDRIKAVPTTKEFAFQVTMFCRSYSYHNVI